MSTNPATVLMRILNALTEPLRRDLSTDAQHRFLGWLAKLQPKIEQLLRQINALLGNDTFSDMGRAEQIAALATASAQSFAWMGVLRDELNAALARLRAQLFAVHSPIKDAVLKELRAQEIRSTLRDLAPQERDVEFLTASQEDRTEVLAALFDDPMGLLISDDIKTRGLTDRAKRLQPELFATYLDTTLLREEWTGWCEHVAMLLTDLGGDPAAVAKALAVPLDAGMDTGGGRPEVKGVEWARKILASVA